MRYINLENALQPGTEYVAKYFRENKKEIQVIRHDKKTNTCFEKSEITDLNPTQIIKTIILYDKKGKFYAFVSPELGTESKPLEFNNQKIKYIFRNKPKKERKSLMNLRNSISPVGAEYGTQSPFIPEHYIEGDGFTGTLEKIFIYDSPGIRKKKVDISMGGYGDEVHKISAQLMYKDLIDCLEWKFPNQTEKINF